MTKLHFNCQGNSEGMKIFQPKYWKIFVIFFVWELQRHSSTEMKKIKINYSARCICWGPTPANFPHYLSPTDNYFCATGISRRWGMGVNRGNLHQVSFLPFFEQRGEWRRKGGFAILIISGFAGSS